MWLSALAHHARGRHVLVVVAALMFVTSTTMDGQAPPRPVVLTLRTSVPATGVSVHYPSGGGKPSTVTAAKGMDWVVPIPLPQRQWITEVDVSVLLPDGNLPLYLYLRSTMIGRNERSTVHPQLPVLNLPQIRALGRLLGQGNEESVLEAYFKARGACAHWQTTSLRHDAGIHACKIWFDAAHRLATAIERPYRMDPGARRAIEDYEGLAKQDQAFSVRYREVVRPGYVSRMLLQIDAIEFGDASFVKKFIDDRRYDDAVLLNEYLIGRWGRTPAALQGEITKLQGVTEELLLSNRNYLATLTSRRN